MDIPAGTVVTLVSRADDCPMAAVKVRPGLWELHPVSNAAAHAVQVGSSSLKPVFPECVFVVLRKGPFYGFRSVCAEGRNLQAVKTEGTPHRCANYNFNTWETWEAVLKEASPGGSENQEVIFRNRAWGHKVLDVDVKQLRSFLMSDVIHLDVGLRREGETRQVLEDKLREANAVLGEMEAALSREAAKVQSERSELGYKVEQLQVGASKLEGILNEKMSLVRSMEDGMQRLRDAEREASKSASALRLRVAQLTEEGLAKEEALLTLERERFRLAAALEMLAREVQNSKGMEQATQSRNGKGQGASSSSGTHELSVGSAGTARRNEPSHSGSHAPSGSQAASHDVTHASNAAGVRISASSASGIGALPIPPEIIAATKSGGVMSSGPNASATHVSNSQSFTSAGAAAATPADADGAPPASSSRRVLGERSTNTLTTSADGVSGASGSGLKVRVRRSSASSTASSVRGYSVGDGRENSQTHTVVQEKADRTMSWLQKVAPTYSANYSSHQASPSPDQVLASLSASRGGGADRRLTDSSGTVPQALRYRPASVTGDASMNVSSRPAGRSLEDICVECWEPRVACLCASNAVLV
eukprot:jgi/Mesvir1/24679/Mv21971-RA.1